MEKNKQKDPYGYIIYYLDVEDHGTPHIIDYAKENLKNRIINPDEIIIPDDKITLRYRSAIHDKYSDKYFKYVEDGIIKPADCYIIALNGCKIPWHGGDFEPPRIIRCVLPFGWQEVTINTSSHEVVKRGHQYRAYLRKTSGYEVDTDIFIKSEYSNITAIIFSNVDFANLTPTMGDDFIIIHNPLASIKLPDNFPEVGREYKAELSKDTIKLLSKDFK